MFEEYSKIKTLVCKEGVPAGTIGVVATFIIPALPARLKSGMTMDIR